ncbi:MAG: DUF1016 family protein [Salinivirgaceae bacterium]|nr:DUF1016 family protein [Salinivirgaceae bacterium]
MSAELSHIESSFVSDIKRIVDEGRRLAYGAVNAVMIETYWHIGRRIVEQEQNGEKRAEYGTQLIEMLSDELTLTYGKGFSGRYLRAFRQFYLVVPDIEIWKSRFPNLTWTHIFRTLRVNDDTAIRWYLETAAKESWSVRVLNRNIDTQYFERHFKQPSLPSEKTNENKAELLKSPIIAEFLGFKKDDSYNESQLESAIISHLQEFIMEMGRGFAFVGRQQLIRTAAQDYFIDLVFYNIVLKCYVLIDLKIGKIKHQDVGQMDMYVRMYDEMKNAEGNNPTIGIVLCSETDEDIAKYSILNGSEQLFATKYKLYLPTEDELRREIERQKELYLLQHNEH